MKREQELVMRGRLVLVVVGCSAHPGHLEYELGAFTAHFNPSQPSSLFTTQVNLFECPRFPHSLAYDNKLKLNVCL